MKIILTTLQVLFISPLLFALNVNAENTTETNKWRTVPADTLMVMSIDYGDKQAPVVFELAQQFAPKHVAHFTELAKQGHYDNSKFYRVIDGFVAQAGPEQSETEQKKAKTLAMESEWSFDKSPSFSVVQQQDLFAELTGISNGFAIAASKQENKAWLAHCPGVLAMARGNDKDSATSHFYITNGQAPRYLDRIMTIFGRVVYGMNHVQAITRTAVIDGDTPVSEDSYTKITSMTLMSDLPKTQQFSIQVENTESKAFAKKLDDRRARNHEFFYRKPPQVLDVCQVPVQSRIVR
ncbi:MAG: peptidylprolyl isomerase [Gammaproteobacteria bacterium]|nr:peptidylprolyl isomerase [Gammaproteobacteria bacterium]